MKRLILAILLAIGLLGVPEKTEAKTYEFAYVFADGCVGIHTHHTYLWGYLQWDTYERLWCPGDPLP